jgi:hypothetical protein
MAASPSPSAASSRWPTPPGLRAFLLLLACVAASVSPATASAGKLRQVVARADDGPFFEPFNVTYDHRAVRIGGERRMLVSAGLHYPRATPQVSNVSCFCAWGALVALRSGELLLVAAAASIGAPRSVLRLRGWQNRLVFF